MKLINMEPLSLNEVAKILEDSPSEISEMVGMKIIAVTPETGADYVIIQSLGSENGKSFIKITNK